MELTPDMLQALLASGRAFSFTPEAGLIVEASESEKTPKERRAARNRRYYERLKASESVLIQTQPSDSDAIKTPPLPLSPSLPLSPQTPLSPAHPHAPTPAHTAPAHTREGTGFSLVAEEPKRRSSSMPADDDAWLTTLASNPIYSGINIQLELGKMQVWCQANNCQPSRRRFVNWLNKIERGIVVAPEPMTPEQRAISGWFDRRPDEPWSAEEMALWRTISKPIHADDWQALEWFYTVAKGDKRLCQSLRALLTKWRSEIDRAKNYNPDEK